MRRRNPFSTAVSLELVRAGMSQRDLADRLEVPPSTLSQWMSGAFAPPSDLVARIEQILSLAPGLLPPPPKPPRERAPRRRAQEA